MKKFLKSFVFICLVAILFVSNNSYASEAPASVNIHLEITNGASSLYDKDIAVLPCDSDNDGTIDVATPYCAIVQSGISNDWTWYSFGAMLDSLDDISGFTSKDSEGNDVYHYWSWSLNGVLSTTGLNEYTELKSGDTVSLDFINPSENDTAKVITSSGGPLVKDEYSIKNAVNFLFKNQEKDGSFGNPLYTDWVAIGVTKTKEDKTDDLVSSLSDYMKSEKFAGISITDHERHAMALMSLDINPYDGTDVNYVEKIVNSFDGEQIGDKSLINDDIFGLLVLQNAGYSKDDEIIQKVISNILKNQSVDGSWGSVDMTSAGIMALDNYKNIPDVNDSILKAYKFIKKGEKDGNYGNVFSTSWAMQAFSLRDYYSDEIYRTSQFLAREQDNEDGFIKVDGKDNQIWATAYSIPAGLKMSWTEIMNTFPKQEVKIYSNLPKQDSVKINKFKKEILQAPVSENIVTDNNSPENNSNSNILNFFKDKVIIMTIVLTLITFIGGWFVIRR